MLTYAAFPEFTKSVTALLYEQKRQYFKHLTIRMRFLSFSWITTANSRSVISESLQFSFFAIARILQDSQIVSSNSPGRGSANGPSYLFHLSS